MSAKSAVLMSRLEWSVRALSQPKNVQESLFPPFVCLADELALDFDESYRGIQAERVPLATNVWDTLLKLDEQLEQMSGQKNTNLWTDEGLAGSVEWERVRELAGVLVRIVGWSTSPPDPNPNIYLGPR